MAEPIRCPNCGHVISESQLCMRNVNKSFGKNELKGVIKQVIKNYDGTKDKILKICRKFGTQEFTSKEVFNELIKGEEKLFSDEHKILRLLKTCVCIGKIKLIKFDSNKYHVFKNCEDMYICPMLKYIPNKTNNKTKLKCSGFE